MKLFLVFLFAYSLSQFYRSFLAVIAPELSTEIGLTASDLANITGTWFLVFALAQFPLGVALDKLGPRRTVPAIMMAAVVGAVLLAYAQTPMVCIIANGLIGLGCSPIYMGGLYMFARTQDPAKFGFLTSWLLGLGSSGNLLSATPLSYAAETLGWRTTLVCMAAITFLAAAVVYVFVRDPPRVERPEGTAKGSAVSDLMEILSIRALWPLIPILLLAYGTVLAERSLWIGPFFAEVYNLDPVPRGNAVLAMAAAMTAGALLYGVADRIWNSRKNVIAIGTGITACLFLLMGFRPSAGLAEAVIMLSLAGIFGLANPIIAAQARNFFPPHLLGRGLTTVNFMTIGGVGLVQFVSGIYVSNLNAAGMAPADIYASLHFSFGVALVVVTAIYLLSRDDRKKDAKSS